MAGHLTVRDVHVVYKLPGRRQLAAVDGVSFDLAPGEVLGLVGESGCGKSTLARTICGLEPLAAGTVEFDGQPVVALGLRKRPGHLLRIQMVFQNPYSSLNPRRRVGDQIEDALAIAPPSERSSVDRLLDDVELDRGAANLFPHQFSGGQRQRIAIARAMGARPDVLVGDEPIASLDASLQAKVATLMRDVALKNGASLLFISHDLSVVRVVADRVAVMQAGRIVETGPVAAVWNAPTDPYTRRLLAAIPTADGLGRLPAA
ncbi:ABC transporter ATP-binding protein [Subtercola boreus]|uniref:Peptide ABC transporter ATP-binding protein n=1 Tax=Subtercola boreus TaxID=120213 RepID=A0A3E0WF98_9MICO|nr:ATP-binding cassette domain-containing protein [Subtercola boreus]RFA22791.1 peptide ABC transporter ATP-binding protein [Subtercola boreus]RFA23146.1 peptide ABC transporter ATP-binding protein [Subtercola boreus]RFA28899.1 peptide ABC transporter ATP-binding protein [Subtercola boreus]